MRHAGRMDLEAVRQELEQMVRESDAEIQALALEQDGEGDEADLSAELTEADREEALAEAAHARREEALAALQRINAGTYGVCIDCGKAIPEERLAFRPEVARCLEDQKAFENREG